MQRDTNNDGKLTRDELPDQMVRMLERGDANNDGALTKDEIIKMFERLNQQRQQGGQRPGGDRPDGDRPQRPQRPE